MIYILYATGEQPINKHILQMERHIFDKDIIGCVQKNIIFWNKDGYGQWFWTDEDIKQMNTAGEKLLNHETAKLTLERQKKEVTDYWKAANSLLLNLDKEGEQLVTLYQTYIFNLRRIYAHFVTTTAHVTLAVETKLKQILDSSAPTKSEEYYQILTTPHENDILLKELIEWRKLLDNPDEKSILEHAKKYSILLANITSEDDALKWAKNRVEHTTKQKIDKEIEEANKRRSNIKKQQTEIFANLNNQEIKELAWFIQNAALTRLLIKSCWNGEVFHMLPFYKKMAQKANCSVRDVYMFYTYKEIIELINNKIISSDELQNRKAYFLLYFSDSKIKSYSGESALLMKKEILDPHLPDKNTKSFTGTIANKGMVVGKARIVKADDPNKLFAIAETLGKDDILVTGMTNPTMMILVKKVKGIITDEGGAACHAAIISREVGLPCIVGCSIATLILDDGDLIKLDENKGIVNRIGEEEFNELIKLEKRIVKVRKKVTAEAISTIREGNIFWFKDISKNDIATVGGKGANLGEMFNLFPVPNGFCISVNAYDSFLKTANIKLQIIALLKNLDVEDSNHLNNTSMKIRELIIKQNFPEQLKKDIITNYLQLNSKNVAVRSSATAEDLPSASFAGQQDTYLNVKDEKSLINSVQKCWASLFTSRAIYYRVKNNFEHEHVSISVVVQEMIEADFAGVMFTIDPVNKKHMLIEAVQGLGESLVSGKTTPNSYLIDKKNMKIHTNKELFNLDTELILKMAKIGKQIEEHYNMPMDIEYAIKDNNPFILQARMITTL